MFPLVVDPGWYDAYWFSDRPQPKRRALSGSVARFAVLVVLLAGSGLVLEHFHGQHAVSGYQDWEME